MKNNQVIKKVMIIISKLTIFILNY